MRGLWLMLAVVVVGPEVRADVIPSGRKGIQHEAFVQLGEDLRGCVVECVVAEGDTLSGLAEKWLGAADRWPEIAARNELDEQQASSLAVGQKLLLPPVQAGERTRHLFVLIHYPFNIPPRRLQVGAPVPFFKTSFQIAAVDESHVEEFLRKAEPRSRGFGRESELVKLLEDEKNTWLAASEGSSVDRTVGLLSPTKSMSTTFRVDGITGREVQVSVAEVTRVSITGTKTTTRRDEPPETAESGPPMAMATLGLGSLGVLLLLVRRRRDLTARSCDRSRVVG